MDLHKELHNLTDETSNARQECRADAAQQPMKALEAVCRQVGHAWSSSNLGYHSTVYYRHFEPTPPEVIFSAEWGLGDHWPTYRPDPGWQICDRQTVIEYLLSRAGKDRVEIAKHIIAAARERFFIIKENAISIFHVSLSSGTDSFIQRQLEAVEKLDPPDHYRIARLAISDGQVFSRDSLAMSQGFRIAPHQELAALPASLYALERAFEGLEKALSLSATHLARIDERYPKMKPQVGTKVFIGHGRSPLWRELKDFLRERLDLTVEEFNSSPAAGLTTAERLAEMLDTATFAFLVMTAEDRQADGSTRARENVVHEVGLFQGRLGFKRAIVLFEEGCQEFSNIVGLVQIRFPKGHIAAGFEEIRRVLERERVIAAGLGRNTTSPIPKASSEGDTEGPPELSPTQARELLRGLSDRPTKALRFIAERPEPHFFYPAMVKAVGADSTGTLGGTLAAITRRVRTVLGDPGVALISYEDAGDEPDAWTGRVSATTHASLRKALGLS